ncbi:MAG: cupin [Burkholderiales bacterium PBB6]|jgi:uncharacterized cupin superfamily protein|uniref:Cupin domain-containing protein n=1 Tax=Ideonella margarita TaxID=2984191 RepID=A0ABU9C2G4_9BURK|nr:MAG: cupin [Burkholderiales bacterium PBB6]
MSEIVVFDQPATPPVIDQPREERREVGVPDRLTWSLYESGPEGLAAGIWECGPGRWRIAFGPREHEYFVVLSGRARIHSASGAVTDIGPGQAVIIPANFQGSFEVLERVRKHFVVVEQ